MLVAHIHSAFVLIVHFLTHFLVQMHWAGINAIKIFISIYGFSVILNIPIHALHAVDKEVFFLHTHCVFFT